MHPAHLHATVRRPAREQHQIEHAQLKALNGNGSTDGWRVRVANQEVNPKNSQITHQHVYFRCTLIWTSPFQSIAKFIKIQPNLTQKKGQFSQLTKFFSEKNLHQLPRRSSQLLKQTSPTYSYSFNKTSGFMNEVFSIMACTGKKLHMDIPGSSKFLPFW